MTISTPEDVLSFWFCDIGAADYPAENKALWWGKDAQIDATCTERFEATWEAARRGDLKPWAETARGRLAHVIVLDQLSRNMFRDTPKMYELDPEAQDLVLEGLELGVDRGLHRAERQFFYMPLMHAENVALQRACVRAFQRLVEESAPAEEEGARYVLGYAEQHAVIVERFGRFPHRNQILGRDSTAEETEFLTQPGSSF